MPWNRNDDPDPLEPRRRQLAEQERLLSEQRKWLTAQLHGESSPGNAKPAEPPIWRREEDAPHERAGEATTAPKRNLARQRQNDMILAFGLIILFLIVVIVLWVAYVHNTSPANGA